jgi:hypothetical protein
MKRVLSLTLGIVAAIVAAEPSQAAPPRNDNYLASTTINAADGSLPPLFEERVDTTDATTQADTFNPNRDGLPFGGGKREPTSCAGSPPYGKTVWYDFAPPTRGAARIAATGFDNVIAVYEWNVETSQLQGLVACQNTSTGLGEEMLLPPLLQRGRNYTIQLGGVAGAGGALDFSFEFFADSDGDRTLDEAPDKCLRLRGIPRFGGCPPLVKGAARVTVQGVAGGVRVLRLTVDRADKRTRVEVRCRRCGPRVRARAPRGGSIRVRGFEGRVVGAGDQIEVRIKRPRSGRGRFRFGAIGKVVRWPITSAGLGESKLSCTRPGAKRKIACP